MTLIEVVAGIALLGTLMVMVLIGSSQHLRQLKVAKQKRQAIALLDRFLAGWASHDFSDEGLSDAARRTGMSVIGDFGQRNQKSYGGGGSEFVVEIRSKPATSERGQVLRFDVSAVLHNGSSRKATWAEVMVTP